MVELDELSDDEIEAVVNTRGSQKMLAYRRLADGIDVLEDEEQLFESMVTAITKQHSRVNSESTTREFFELFVAEVDAYTEGVAEEDDDAVAAAELSDLVTNTP